MSQSGLSQGMSQGDMSQDSVMMQPDIHSQLDNLLSQDSTYQGDRFASQSQYLSQFSQVIIKQCFITSTNNFLLFSIEHRVPPDLMLDQQHLASETR